MTTPQNSFDAVKAILTATSFDDLHNALQQHLEALRAPTAVAYLRDLRSRHQDEWHARQLQSHLDLLLAIQQDGLDVAWQRFVVSKTAIADYYEEIRVVLHFLQTHKEPEETLLYLREKQHILLTPHAFRLMQSSIEALEAQPDVVNPRPDRSATHLERLVYLREQRNPLSGKMRRLLHLATDAHEHGIQPAWTGYCAILLQADREWQARHPKQEQRFWDMFNQQMGIERKILRDFGGNIPDDPHKILRFVQDYCRQRSDQPYAIFLLAHAMQFVSPTANPHLWAKIMYARGLAYELTLDGDRVQNKEYAIADYEASLATEPDPHSQGICHKQLAAIYSYRPLGNDEENLRIALEHINAAMQLIPREQDPYFWVSLLVDLATIYQDENASQRDAWTELSIADLDEALAILTPHPFAYTWARAHFSRGNAYALRRIGDVRQNREQALADYDAALSLEEEGTEGWAAMHQSRGAALAQCDEADKQEAGIREYDLALSYATREVNPFMHATLLLNRAETYTKLRRWSEAHEDYVTVRAMQREALDSAASESSRAGHIAIRAKREPYLRDVEALLHSAGRHFPDLPAHLAIILEEGRAQSLRARLDLDAVHAKQVPDVPEAQRILQDLVEKRDIWRAIQRELAAGPPDSEDRQTFFDVGKQRLRQAHAAFQQARDALRRFVPDYLSPLASFEDIAAAVRAPDEALVYVTAGEESGHAVVVTRDTQMHAHARYMPLPHMTRVAVAVLQETRAPIKKADAGGLGERDEICGGLIHGQTGAAFDIFQRWARVQQRRSIACQRTVDSPRLCGDWKANGSAIPVESTCSCCCTRPSSTSVRSGERSPEDSSARCCAWNWNGR